MDKRLQKLQKLLARLGNGEDVQRRDLKSALTDSEWEEFNSWWTDEKDNRNLTPPKELARYIKLRKSVALASARYTRYAGRPRSKTTATVSKKLAESADNEQDKLLEYLREQVAYNPSLMMWLVAVEPYRSVEETLEAGVLPQVCTSRTVSSDKRAPMGKRSKRDLKIQILEQAIATIEGLHLTPTAVVASSVKTTKRKDFSGFKV